MRVIWVCVTCTISFLIGCVADLAPRECTSDDDCLSSGLRGSCLAPAGSSKKWCAFGSSSCGSGLKWGSRPGDGLAEVCIVDGPHVDGGTVDANDADAPPRGVLTLNPPLPPFASVVVGDTSAATIMVKNEGSATVRSIATTIDGADASSFSFDVNTCAGHDVDPGASCALSVRFEPTVGGARSASLSVSGGFASDVTTVLSASARSTLSVTVLGTGTGTIVSDPPGISCTSGTCSHDFAVASVKLEATANPSNDFVSWSVGSCAARECTIALDAASRAITGTFTRVICVNSTSGNDANRGD